MGVPPVCVKKIAEQAPLAATKQNKERGNGGALAATAIGTGGYGLYNVDRKGLITGREAMTHITGKRNVPSILEKGIDARRALDPGNLTSHIGLAQEQMANKVYMGRKAITPYAVMGGIRNTGNHEPLEILKARVPSWMLKEVDNPELRGAKTFSQFNKTMTERSPMWNLSPAKQRKTVYNVLGRKGTATFEGGIAPEYLLKSDKYKRVSLPEVLGYMKAKPARFAGGVALGLASLGGIGYGAHKLLKAKEGQR